MKLTKEWITGFVDGDGCFATNKKGRSSFFVSQDQRSVDVLYALKKEFGCGTVNRAGGTMYNYQISKEEHIRDICIPFFIRYPLQTRKKYVFQRWVHSFREHMIAQNKDPGIAISLVEEYRLTPDWFRGFVDADGCFSVTRVGNRYQPRFFLGAHQDAALMKECRKLIACGALRHRKDDMDMLQVSAIQELEKNLFPFFETRGSAVLLRTIKRISFQKFRKIVRFILLGRTTAANDLKKIEKLRASMNQYHKPTILGAGEQKGDQKNEKNSFFFSSSPFFPQEAWQKQKKQEGE